MDGFKDWAMGWTPRLWHTGNPDVGLSSNGDLGPRWYSGLTVQEWIIGPKVGSRDQVLGPGMKVRDLDVSLSH